MIKHPTNPLNYGEFMIEDYHPAYYEEYVVAMHFSHSLIFKKKILIGILEQNFERVAPNLTNINQVDSSKLSLTFRFASIYPSNR